MCVCVCERERERERVCVCARERPSVGEETARERRWGDSERSSGTKRQRELARNLSPLRRRERRV